MMQLNELSSRYGNSTENNFPVDPDPRVQTELENLNTSTEFINKLEFELEKARTEFNQLLSESTHRIETLSKKLGSSISKARPYYEGRIAANELHKRAQKEAQRYEQAMEEHKKAKEMVHLVEIKLNRDKDDSKWEEILTESGEKVNQAELARLGAERQHEVTSREYNLTEQRLAKLHQQFKRSIVQASLETRRNLLDINNYANQHQLQLLPYFEMKNQFNQMLDEQMNKIHAYENRVNKAKMNYTKALQRLEELNSKIYEEGTMLPCFTQDSNDSNSSTQLITSSRDDSIFDNALLGQLVLEDHIDLQIDRIRDQCLNSDK